MDINNRLRHLLDKAKIKTPLFQDLKSHTYLQRPNHIILKPLFGVLILTGLFFSHKELNELVKGEFDFMQLSKNLKLAWRKKKHLLKDKHFMDRLYNFDVRAVRKDQADLLLKMYQNDNYMTFNLIKRESQISAYLFLWTQEVYEFIQVVDHVSKIGIQDLED